MKADLIIYNSQLLTCASQGRPKRASEMQEIGLIEDGAVSVAEEKIVAVGKTNDILRDFESENVIDAKGKVVSPGFVECHTHIVFAGDRLNEFELKIKGADYLEILDSGGGILSTVRQTRKATLDDLAESAYKRLSKMLAFGVTTCEIKTGYGLDLATEVKMLDVIAKLDQTHAADVVPTFLAAHAIPPEFKEKEDEFTNLICEEMIPLAANWYKDLHFFYNQTPFFIDVFCEKNAFSPKQSKKILETGKKFGFKLKAHVDEFTNLGGARIAVELGATSIDHLDTISNQEITLLANSNTIGVVTPTVNFNFGSKEFADARKLIDSGCAVAISTDYNPGSAPCPSLPNAMAIAARYQKLLPSETFNAVTINAAFALGLGDKIGSLEVGKKADILIFDTKDFREIVYEFGGNQIEQIFKDGTALMLK
jgi:imidazolonepropionase